MQILYGAMRDEELMTIKQAKHIKETEERRQKMSQEAKELYERSRQGFDR